MYNKKLIKLKNKIIALCYFEIQMPRYINLLNIIISGINIISSWISKLYFGIIEDIIINFHGLIQIKFYLMHNMFIDSLILIIHNIT